MYHWVIQIFKGVYYAHGPYRTPEGAENRYSKVIGGEIYLYSGPEDTAEKAIDSFKSKQISGRTI